MISKIIILFVSFYQRFISPMFPRCCRFYPTCSCYAKDAIGTYGLKGVLLAFRRLIRCHPLNPGGYDPVPKE